METKKNLENVDITNNCIIDLKLKVSKVDYYLTTLLDYNNTVNLNSDEPLKLIGATAHSDIANTLMSLCDLLFNSCKTLYQDDKEKGINNEKSTDKQDIKTSGL